MAILKLFHLLFVFVWMGTLLSLTRLLAYLAKEERGVQKRLQAILKRMYLFIDLPSMILAIVLGVLLLIWKGVNLKAGWLHMKLTFSFLLIISDVLTGRLLMSEKIRKAYLYKILHTIVALLLIGILVAIYIFKART